MMVDLPKYTVIFLHAYDESALIPSPISAFCNDGANRVSSHTLQTNNAISAEAFIQILANPKWKYCPYANIFFAIRCRDRKSCTLKIYLIGMLKCIVLQELEIIWHRFSKHLIKGTKYYFSFIFVSNYESLLSSFLSSYYHHYYQW